VQQLLHLDRLPSHVVRFGSYTGHLVGRGEARREFETIGDRRLVQGIDENAGSRRDEFRRAANPSRHDRACAGHRLEKRLPERLDEAWLAEDASVSEVLGDAVMWDSAQNGDSRSPFELRTEWPLAHEGQRPVGEAIEGIREPDDVLALRERADAQVSGRAVRPRERPKAFEIDAGVDHRDLPPRPRHVSLQRASKVIGDRDHSRSAPDDGTRRQTDAVPLADVGDVLPMGGDHERHAWCRHGRDGARRDQEVGMNDVRLEAARGYASAASKLEPAPPAARTAVEDRQLDLVATVAERELELAHERAEIRILRPWIHLRDDQNAHAASVTLARSAASGHTPLE
jgi:hypothetical protein